MHRFAWGPAIEQFPSTARWGRYQRGQIAEHFALTCRRGGQHPVRRLSRYSGPSHCAAVSAVAVNHSHPIGPVGVNAPDVSVPDVPSGLVR